MKRLHHMSCVDKFKFSRVYRIETFPVTNSRAIFAVQTVSDSFLQYFTSYDDAWLFAKAFD